MSTPWGDLLLIRFLRSSQHTEIIKTQIRLVDIVKNRLVKWRSAAVFQEHAVFVGQNHSACLPTKNFPELSPTLRTSPDLFLRIMKFGASGPKEWKGLGFTTCNEEVFPCYEHEYSNYLLPYEVWITPNL
ncbi:hypothetical protein PR202_gb26050 [Eleusine coracana subsp. coracana]|uniref:Uncharacterized protein n=1 Tax=Eleusine coracana subsp. coracana TaxID=191504 RepID=A0AAV5FRR2_ELECO|nr:hypothetical protein PR202_gb26050 [Eleusine coracana subsp. coracana]